MLSGVWEAAEMRFLFLSFFFLFLSLFFFCSKWRCCELEFLNSWTEKLLEVKCSTLLSLFPSPLLVLLWAKKIKNTLWLTSPVAQAGKTHVVSHSSTGLPLQLVWKIQLIFFDFLPTSHSEFQYETHWDKRRRFRLPLVFTISLLISCGFVEAGSDWVVTQSNRFPTTFFIFGCCF